MDFFAAAFGAVDSTPSDWLERIRSEFGPGWSARVESHSAPGVVALYCPNRCGIHQHPESRVFVVGRARIDNRETLFPAQKRQSDLSAICHGYLRWGVDSPRRFVGDFATTVWDPRTRTLYCMRDALGVRPLYYSEAGDAIYVSSCVEPLLGAGVGRQADSTSVAAHLLDQAFLPGHSAFSAVRCVEPGCVLTWRQQRTNSFQYWSPAEHASSIRRSRDFRDEFIARLTTAVERRIPPNSEPAVALSGGLDSSAVACVAAAVQRRRSLDTYSVSARFQANRSCDEHEYQSHVVSQAATKHLEVFPEECSACPTTLQQDARDLASFDLMGGQWIIYQAARAAAARRVGVMLTGFDGDSVIGHGQSLVQDYANRLALNKLVGEIRTEAGIPWSRFVRHLARAIEPTSLRFVRRSVLLPFREPGIGLAGWVTRHAVYRNAQLATELASRGRARAYNGFHLAKHEHVRNLASQMRLWDLDLADRIGGVVGVDILHPFYDRELVEFCLGVPPEHLRHKGVNRHYARIALKGLVPDNVLGRRTKINFGPFVRWMYLQRLSCAFDELYVSTNLQPVVHMRRLRRVHRTVVNNPDGTPPSVVALLWRLACLSAWQSAYRSRIQP